MKPDRISDAELAQYQPPVEGRAWCPRCDRPTGYTLSKVEFLGNPVKASFFCTDCGARMHPEATERNDALRKQSEGRWLRVGAAGSFVLILLFPLILATAILFFLWRIR